MALDSGANKHFLNNPDAFDEIHPATEAINIADGRKIHSEGHGPALGFPDAIYVPSFSEQLLSIYRICKDHDAVVTCTKTEANISINNVVKLVGYPTNGLYRIQVNKNWQDNNYSCANLANAQIQNIEDVVHRRLAHQGTHHTRDSLTT